MKRGDTVQIDISIESDADKRFKGKEGIIIGYNKKTELFSVLVPILGIGEFYEDEIKKK